MKRILLVLIILAMVTMSIGSTVASFSDIEVSPDNVVQTGNIDLKVVKRDLNWNPISGVDFTDDEPWGYGLERCFFVEQPQAGQIYQCNLEVWNSGSQDGDAYIHLKIIEDLPLPGVAPITWVRIWYDINNSGGEDSGEIIEGTLSDLACQHLPQSPTVWPLTANAVRQLAIQVQFTGSLPGSASLLFDTEFILLSGYLTDTEKSHSYFNKAELGGTPGFWRSPRAVTLYGQDNLETWFRQIVTSSAWFDSTLSGYSAMCDILKAPAGNSYEDMVAKFRSQYLATLLNTKTVPARLGLGTSHDISGINGAGAFFGYPSGTLTQIISTIEAKASETLNKGEVEIMKDVCDALNNLDI